MIAPPTRIHITKDPRRLSKVWVFNWQDGTVPPFYDTYWDSQYWDGKLTISQNNRVSQLGRSSGRVGGDFQVYRRKYTTSSTLAGSASAVHLSKWPGEPLRNGGPHIYGPLFARVTGVFDSSSLWDNVTPSSMSQLDALGATAISRIIPTNPVSDLATQIGETYFDSLPLMPGIASWSERCSIARKAGKEYLNYEFGWKPLVSEVRKLAFAIENSHRILKAYERDSGKLLHRKYEFPVEKTSVVSDESYGETNRPDPTSFIGNIYTSDHIGHYVHRTTIETRQWFEGTFTFYLPPLSAANGDGYAARAKKLLGIRLTPDVLWELAPWSWAVDWFSNTGDIIHNISAFMADGLEMPYGYMMETKSIISEHQLSGVAFVCYPGQHVFRETLLNEVKTRRTAHPFGFGLSDSDLTPRQIAIMAALGLSGRG